MLLMVNPSVPPVTVLAPVRANPAAVTRPELDTTKYSVPVEPCATMKSPLCEAAPVRVRMSLANACCLISDSPNRGTAKPL